MDAIKVENLVKKYGDFTAVDDISFSVKKGEVFGFIGPNGAGKTTSISMLCTLLKPTSGNIFINGHDIKKDPNFVRRSIGIVFQEPSLDQNLTAFENLDFHGMIYDIPNPERGKMIKEMLALVELESRKNELVKTFSGGMRRRLEIARGLIHKPEILFLDEPTWGLDPQTRINIWEYIFELKRSTDLAIFLTTHYLNEAEVCDNIYIIDTGKIVANGTPEELKKQVGGDVVTLETSDNNRAADFILEKFMLESKLTGDGLQFEVERGDKFIPLLLKELVTEVLSISLRRPSLDDVFMKLTGKQIREQELDSLDLLRESRKFKRRRSMNVRNK